MTLFGQNVLNVYHALRRTPIEGAGSISDGFQNSVLPTIRALQNVAVTNNELRIFNLGETTDFGTFTLSAALGLRVGLASPSFVAGECRFPTRDRDIKNGYKRFRGMQETDYTDGVLTASALSTLDDIGTALVAPWLSSIDAHPICDFVIVKRICETTDPITGKCLEYRLPDTDLELKTSQPNQAQSIVSARSQVSSRVPI